MSAIQSAAHNPQTIAATPAFSNHLPPQGTQNVVIEEVIMGYRAPASGDSQNIIISDTIIIGAIETAGKGASDQLAHEIGTIDVIQMAAPETRVIEDVIIG